MRIKLAPHQGKLHELSVNQSVFLNFCAFGLVILGFDLFYYMIIVTFEPVVLVRNMDLLKAFNNIHDIYFKYISTCMYMAVKYISTCIYMVFLIVHYVGDSMLAFTTFNIYASVFLCRWSI